MRDREHIDSRRYCGLEHTYREILKRHLHPALVLREIYRELSSNQRVAALSNSGSEFSSEGL